jgi:hypothetical protein
MREDAKRWCSTRNGLLLEGGMSDQRNERNDKDAGTDSRLSVASDAELSDADLEQVVGGVGKTPSDTTMSITQNIKQ